MFRISPHYKFLGARTKPDAKVLALSHTHIYIATNPVKQVVSFTYYS